jgi:HlyD family secretion protein
MEAVMKKKSWKITLIITTLALGIGGASIFFALQPSESEAANAAIEVQQGDLLEVAAASGTIEPNIQVEVKSRASGEVIQIFVQEGEEVQVGQVLLLLDPRDAEQEVREAEMNLTRARSNLTQARAQLTVSRAQAEEARANSATRNRGAELGLISTEDQRSAATSADVAQANVTLRQAQLRSSQLDVESAQLRVEEAQRRLEETTILAPVSGTVLSVGVEVGSIVASGITNVSGGTTLMTIADLSELRVIGAIDEAQIGQVNVGQDVAIRVSAFPEQVFEGRVERVSPLGRESSNVVTFDVEIVVTDENASSLRSGMSADLEIVTESHEGVPLIPITAIQGQGRRQFVTLSNGERRAVKTGATDGIRLVVLQGLEAGDLISTKAPTSSTKRPANPSKATKSLIPVGGGRGRR